MKNICVVLADGFEEIEALTVVDLCRRANIHVVTASISDTKTVTGSHQITVIADELFDAVDFKHIDMLVLPGGMPGTKHLQAHSGLCAQLKNMVAEKKQVAAICAAPSVLGNLGLLSGTEACCYPGFEDQLLGARVSDKEVCCGEYTTTSLGLGTAIAFALKLIERLSDRETAAQIADSIQFQTSNS